MEETSSKAQGEKGLEVAQDFVERISKLVNDIWIGLKKYASSASAKGYKPDDIPESPFFYS